MSTGIIIATHGVAAKYLLETTQMLIGEQDDVAFIEFVAGENAETIIEKYKAILEGELKHCSDVLFLVDAWGGSPFNAASRICVDQDNMEIVAGVNVPMLIEVFLARDDDEGLEELSKIAQRAGKDGIKAFKFQQEEAKPKAKKVVAPQPTTAVDGEHMKIGLARVDDRLIHGQVATRWTKESNVSRIIVVNDAVVKDSVRSSLLKEAAPPGVSAHVVSVEKMVRVYNNPEYARDRVMLLFTNPQDALTLIEAGLEIKSLNIGGMAYQEGKKQITSAVSVNEQDVASFVKMNELKIELDVRKVSSDNQVYMMDLLKKNNLL